MNKMHKSVQNVQKCLKIAHSDFFATFQWLRDTIWKLNRARLINDEEYR